MVCRWAPSPHDPANGAPDFGTFSFPGDLAIFFMRFLLAGLFKGRGLLTRAIPPTAVKVFIFFSSSTFFFVPPRTKSPREDLVPGSVVQPSVSSISLQRRLSSLSSCSTDTAGPPHEEDFSTSSHPLDGSFIFLLCIHFFFFFFLVCIFLCGCGCVVCFFYFSLFFFCVFLCACQLPEEVVSSLRYLCSILMGILFFPNQFHSASRGH